MDDEILISEHIGPREPLRALFELAEDSATELDTYLPLGRVWTARHDQGFRLRAVVRDVFTPAHGYPPGLLLDGIPLRDRVWLDRPTAGRALRPDAAGPRRRL